MLPPYCYMEHKLDFLLYSEGSSDKLVLVDNSSYFEKPSNLLYEVKLPSFKEFHFGYGKYSSVTSFSPENLGIDQATFPDGLYTIRMSVAPNKKVFICKKVMKTDKLESEMAELIDCLDSCNTDLVDKLYEIDKLIFASKINTDDKLRIDFFNLASKKLKTLKNGYNKK